MDMEAWVMAMKAQAMAMEAQPIAIVVAMAVAMVAVVVMVAMVTVAATHCAIEDPGLTVSIDEFLQLPSLLTITFCLNGSVYDFPTS